MARKKTEWPALAERKFERLAKKGASAQDIARELTADGVAGASAASVGRRLRDLFGDRRAGKAAPEPSSEPAKEPEPRAEDGAPADIPTDAEELASAPLEKLEWWLSEVQEAFELAKADQNVAAQASLAGRARDYLILIQKHAPQPPVDLNAALDIRATAQKGRKLFFDTLENIIGNRGVLSGTGTP